MQGTEAKMADRAPTQELGTLAAAFEATGSPRWIMHTIRSYGLDAKHGFGLEVDFVGDTVKHGLQSTEAALAEGAVDFIDTDWLSIARCRDQGMKIAAAFPYGRIMGGMVVAQDSSIESLEDLRGRRVGVVRRHDKNWCVTRAVCVRRHGFDPHQEAVVDEALSKTVLVGKLKAGEVDAALLYWHLIPHLTVTNRYRQVCDMLDLLPELGIGRCPTTFFAFREETIARSPGLVRAFVAAFREAVELMRARDDVWEELSTALLGGCDGALLRLLRERWESRITTAWNVGVIDDLGRLFDEILRFGGPQTVGCDRIPEGTFTTAFMH
jgi:NitT/TauT family transport system substrate-binding protein